MCRQILLPAGPRGACSTIAAAGRRACRSGLRFCFCPGAHMFPYKGAAGPPCGLKDARKGGRQMRQVVMDCIGTFGYWGVFALIAVENIFPPIPSEVILTFAGFCTAATALRVPGVVAAATLGSLAGALVLYGVGRLLQPQRLDALLAGPAGRALHMEKQDVEKAACFTAAVCLSCAASFPFRQAWRVCALRRSFVHYGGQHPLEYSSGGPWCRRGTKLAARGRGHCLCL